MSETALAAAPVQDPLAEEWPLPKLAVFFAGGLVLYCFSQWLAIATRIQPENTAIFWPPAGVMLALLVMVPKRSFGLMAAAAAGTTLFSNHVAATALGANVQLTLRELTVGVLGALLYRRWIGRGSPLLGIEAYGYFLAIVFLSATLWTALGSMMLQSTLGPPPAQIWHLWFGATVLGLLAATPLLVLNQTWPAPRWMFRPDGEFFATTVSAAFLLVAANTELFSSPSVRLSAVILIIPLLFWVAVRRSPLESSILLSVATIVNILALAAGRSPINLESWPIPESSTWTISVYIIHCGAVLMLAANHAEQAALATRLRSIFDAATDGVISIDERGIVETFSKSAERLFGYAADEVIGNNVKMLMPNPYHDHHDGYITRYMQTGERRIIGIGRLVTGRRKDGSEFPMELSVGEANHVAHRVFTGFIRDVSSRQETERRLQELQDELLHVSRLSAMGELASALAHELNQPLTAIKNYSQAAGLMLKSGKDISELPGVLAKTSEQAGRAGDVIKRLRSFVTARQVEREPHKISQLIEESCALALLGARDDGVKSKIIHGKDLPDVYVDRIQIQQLLINLVRNAVEAMRKAPVRNITITSKLAGKMVAIEVMDTGPGLSQDGEANLFKPFITTKPGGMGIGLSLSRGIAEAHGGTLTYRRNPEGGAVFILALPIETL